MFRTINRCGRSLLSYRSVDSAAGFDSSFAEDMSKPLPQWFLEQEIVRKRLQQEMEEKSKKAIEEFKSKYMISESEKMELIEKSISKKQEKNSLKTSWLGRIIFSNDQTVVKDSEELTTKEKWDIFLNEEKESTGFYLPGIFDVFPELKFKWPVWAKSRDGKAIKCKTDEDCLFPQTCCAHPIIPGDSFCCSGWGRRVMVPAYQTQMIKPTEPSQNQ